MDLAAQFKIYAETPGLQNVERFNRTLQQSGQVGEMSAKQIRQAMRSLPAQFTDVAVSLAGGQSPLMVLLQQGGQIRDQFGSIGAAFRGITSLITPMRLALLGGAGAVGILAKAFIDGEREVTAFKNALALTGGVAGITVNQFANMASTIAKDTNSAISTTKAVLQTLVATGKIGPEALQPAAEAIIKISKLSGQSAEDVAKSFLSNSSSARSFAKSLSESYGTITVAEYKRIIQLEESGKKEEALALAIQITNEKLADRREEIGYLERASNFAAKSFSDFWNALLNIGAPESAEKALVKANEQLIAAEQNARKVRKITEGSSRPSAAILLAEAERAEKAARAAFIAAAERVKVEREAAKEASKSTRENKAGVAGFDEAEKKRTKAREDGIKREQELEKYRLDWLAKQEDRKVDLLNERIAAEDKLDKEQFDRQKQLDAYTLEWKQKVEDRRLELEEKFFAQSRSAFDEYRDSLILTQNQIEEFAIRGTQTLEDGLTDVIMRTKSVGDAFRDMARVILQELARIAVRQLIIAPFANALSSFLPGFGQSLGASPAPAGGVEGGTGLTFNPGKRAVGGAVTSGAPYMVGEAGPELFVPQQSGRIISNDKLSGESVVVNQTINITTGIQQTVRTEIAALLPQISEAAKAAVLDAKKRGGSFAAAF